MSLIRRTNLWIREPAARQAAGFRPSGSARRPSRVSGIAVRRPTAPAFLGAWRLRRSPWSPAGRARLVTPRCVGCAKSPCEAPEFWHSVRTILRTLSAPRICLLPEAPLDLSEIATPVGRQQSILHVIDVTLEVSVVADGVLDRSASTTVKKNIPPSMFGRRYRDIARLYGLRGQRRAQNRPNAVPSLQRLAGDFAHPTMLDRSPNYVNDPERAATGHSLFDHAVGDRQSVGWVERRNRTQVRFRYANPITQYTK